MILRRFCFTLLLLLTASKLSAHVDKQMLQDYKVAKKMYDAHDYEGAREALEPLMGLEERDDITPYAFFYYALAAYHQKEISLAEDTFTIILAEWPQWQEADEVRYWLGQLSLERGDYKGGLAWLAEIKNKRFASAVRKLKEHFLQQVRHTAVLQELLRTYPEDRQLAELLFKQLKQQPLIRRDFDLLQLLERDFNLVFREHDLLRFLSSVKKEVYNVGVFLPLLVADSDLKEGDNPTRHSDNFVLHLYQGIKAAVAALEEEGIKINLFAYDTKKDPATTKKLLKLPEVRQLDLMIGPLHATTVPLVTDFARKYKINLFNPLSENADVVGDNPFVFLSRPSLATQARKAADFTLKHASPDARIGVVYDTSQEGFMQAHLYKQYIERGLGKDVAMMLPIAAEDAPGFLHALRERLEEKEHPKEEEEQKLEIGIDEILAELTHVYVASKDELIAANTLIALEMLKISPCIIGHEAWLDKSSITLDQLQRLRVFLVAPDFIDYTQESIYTFRKSYYERFSQYPDLLACKGYDAMLFLGHMLHRYGTHFQKHWQEVHTPSPIFKDIIYGMHQDNQQVPILQLQKGNFAICD